MKQKSFILFMALMAFSFETQAETQTFQCGDNCTATLDDNGVMRVSGTGQMWGYDNNERWHTPWYSQNPKIKHLIIEDGITNVGKNAFFLAYKIEKIELAQTVQTVDIGAFDEVDSVKSMTIYDSTVFKDQDDFMAYGKYENFKLNCYGNLETCKQNLTSKSPKIKAIPQFNYKGKRIYTVEEANMVTGKKNKVMIRYK